MFSAELSSTRLARLSPFFFSSGVGAGTDTTNKVCSNRFAAADSGGPEMRARAISWVLAGGVAAAVIGPQTVIHTHDLLDPIPGLKFQVLHEAEQQRVGHGHCQQILFELDGNAHALERNFFGNEDDCGRLGWIFAEIDVRKAELIGERFGNLFLGGEIHAHEHGAKSIARSTVLGQRRLEVLVGDQARLNQTLADLFAHSPIFRRSRFPA